MPVLRSSSFGSNKPSVEVDGYFRIIGPVVTAVLAGHSIDFIAVHDHVAKAVTIAKAFFKAVNGNIAVAFNDFYIQDRIVEYQSGKGEAAAAHMLGNNHVADVAILPPLR